MNILKKWYKWDRSSYVKYRLGDWVEVDWDRQEEFSPVPGDQDRRVYSPTLKVFIGMSRLSDGPPEPPTNEFGEVSP